MRIILLEPNLIGSWGHPIEFSSSLFTHGRKVGLEVVVVSNKQINLIAKRLFGSPVLPLITNTCFVDLGNEGAIFLNDLKEIDKELILDENDTVIILTSYTNEIAGTNAFLRERMGSKQPHFCFLIHQLFPPEEDFIRAIKKERKEYWSHRFSDICNNLHKHISLFTTPSLKLRDTIQILTGIRVGTLPLPYHMSLRDIENKSKNRYTTVSFLGDGRYEKGLLMFMEAVNRLSNKKFRFVIQEANLRGYSRRDLDRLENLMTTLRQREDVSFIDKHLSQEEFQQIMDSSDFLALPCHPASYDMRVSGLLIQGLLIEKPAVVSSDTWLADEVKKHSTGLSFVYDQKNTEKSINNLVNALGRMKDEIATYRANTLNILDYYREIHSPSNFFKELSLIK